METDSLINIEDPRNYVLPISNIIGKRLNRITTLNNKLTMLVAKLYSIPDENDKNEICDNIYKIISEIELLILKNIDDTQILEYSLSEFTMKSPILPESVKPTTHISSDQHIYA